MSTAGQYWGMYNPPCELGAEKNAPAQVTSDILWGVGYTEGSAEQPFVSQRKK